MGGRLKTQEQGTASALWAQIALGGLVLVLGALVYVLDRPAEQLPLLSSVNRADALPSIFDLAGGSLPTFAHAFAFSLLTAVWLGGRRRAAFVACLAWFAIDTAFEVGQQPQIAERLVRVVPGWFERLPILEQAGSYFLSGTFDGWDLISIALGAAAAYLVTALTRPGDKHHG